MGPLLHARGQTFRAGRSKQRRERREYLEMTEKPSRIHCLPRGGRKSLINSTHATLTFLLVSDTATQLSSNSWAIGPLFAGIAVWNEWRMRTQVNAGKKPGESGYRY